MSFNKTPLELDKYNLYEIPQEYSAWVYTFNEVDQNRIDDIEYELQTQGHKIFHIETKRVQNGLFEIKIIAAKMPYLF